MPIKYLQPGDRYDIEVFNRNFKEIEAQINELEADNPELITPEEVYADTRPSDWLPMPTPQDDEMYLLFHIPDGVSGLIAFTVTCTGSYTVETGTVVNGVYVSQTSVSKSSGAKYEAELFADDYGDLTSDGYKQVMFRIYGQSIKTWEPSIHSKKSLPANFSGWNIVEIVCRLPEATKVACGHSTNTMALMALRYFAWYGSSKMTVFTSMFNKCRALVTVLALDTSKGTIGQSMFGYCYSLIVLPQIDTHLMNNMQAMFMNCYALTKLPVLNFENATNLYMTFASCYNLRTSPDIIAPKATSAQSMFSGCNALSKVGRVYIPQATTISSMFQDDKKLREVEVIEAEKATAVDNLFYDCSALETIPTFNIGSATNFTSIFKGCFSLRSIPEIDTSKATSLNSMVQKDTSLTKITNLNTQNVSSSGLDNAFAGCFNLSKLTLVPTVTNWAGAPILLSNMSFSREAIIEFFNSLPIITSAKAITLTGNPGVSSLTDADKAIATQKGWTLTL